LNFGTINNDSSELKSAYKTLPDGRLDFAGTISGPSKILMREFDAGMQSFSNRNFMEATAHFSNAVYLRDLSSSTAMQSDNSVMINSDIGHEGLETLYRNTTLAAFYSGQYTTALQFADRFALEAYAKVTMHPVDNSKIQSDAEFMRAASLFSLNKKDEAISALAKSLLLDPNNTNAIHMKAVFPLGK
jgi:hypothetical protein